MILRRYIHREILEKLGWILGLLLLIITSNLLVRYLADAAAGALPTDLIFQMMLVKMAATLPKLMPVAIFLAVISGLARLARDQELLVMSVSGGPRRLQFLPVFQFSLLFAALVLVAGFFMAPWAMKKTEEIKAQAEAQAATTGIRAGNFNEFNKGDQIVYVERVGDGGERMENVFLQDLRDGQLSILNSDGANYIKEAQGDRYMLFQDGRRYVGRPGDLNYQIIKYKTYGVLVQQQSEEFKYNKIGSYSMAALLDSERPLYRAELQWRVSYVIAALLLPMLAFALSRYSYNEYRYLPIVVGTLIYIVYSNLLSISKTLLTRDAIAPELGLWWVHAILFALIVLLASLPKARRMLRLRARRRPAER